MACNPKSTVSDINTALYAESAGLNGGFSMKNGKSMNGLRKEGLVYASGQRAARSLTDRSFHNLQRGSGMLILNFAVWVIGRLDP